MNKDELLRRYAVFLTAITVGALGVTLTARAAIGINSLACFSYVTSVYFPITMGMVTAIFNTGMLISQLFLIPREKLRSQTGNLILQIPALLLFGLVVDLFMMLTDNFHPESYPYGYFWCVLTFIAGSVIIALNVALQAVAAVTKLSCDAFVIILAERMGKTIGRLKLYFDLIMVAAAAVMGLICSNFTEITGIREGTVLGAFIVGPAVQFFFVRLRFLVYWCAGTKVSAAEGIDGR